MKIYTKTGDTGETSLLGGTRVSKANIRIESYGTIDELNSYIGLIRDQPVNTNQKDLLLAIQTRLFTIGSLLATDPAKSKVKTPDLHLQDIETLEDAMDVMDSKLPELKYFVLPGGHASISHCHIARCVCRRAERICIALSEMETVEPLIVIYLNRLSDYLFVLSRSMAMELNAEEIPWKSRS